MAKAWKKDVLTIPNMLSLFRLVLIPVYASIYLNASDKTDYFVAAAILAVSCLTDMIDGKIARRFNMISTTGKILDPIADKATQFTMILCLAINYPVLWIVVGLFVLKESFQLIAGLLALRKGMMLRGARITGKICTTVLFISLIVMVLIPDMKAPYLYTLVGCDILMLVIAFADYARVYFTHSAFIQHVDLQKN